MKNRLRSEGAANAALIEGHRMTTITRHDAHAPRPNIAAARLAVTRCRKARRRARLASPLELAGAVLAFLASAVGFGGAQ